MLKPFASSCLSIVPAVPAPLCSHPVSYTPLRMFVSVITCSGRELVALDADLSWRLIDVLAAIPEQDRAVDCSEHVFIGTTELRPSMSLYDVGVESGSTLTLVTTPVHTAEELEHVVRIIFSKALAEPDNIEAHADLVFSLRTRYPEFPPEHEGHKGLSFTRFLLSTCQEDFESFPRSLDPIQKDKQMAHCLASVKFIGHLFLRQMLSVKIIGQVLWDLIGGVAHIEEHRIECACELLKVIVFSLDHARHGPIFVTEVLGRLVDLKKRTDPNTGKSVYSETVQIQIQDLVDMRGRSWQAKT